ncbi:MAG: Fe-S cluster assembly protein SufB [Coriobacteriales bacterium]|jgi:Fe-S cluster assembly protein SufB
MGKTKVDDVDRSLYDFKKSEEGYERFADGLTPEIVRAISDRKNEPEWMLELRLKGLEKYHEMSMAPNWGPPIDGLDMNHISTYVTPKTKQASSWDDVPEEVRDTFERLGIPEAEREYLAGVGAQYDSELVYHSMQDSAAKQGVVYSGIEEALHGPYEQIIHDHFMKLVPITDHKFAALHAAVWSGGSFVYVPEGVHMEYPLQSYFRLNAAGAGQFEHTLIIVEPGAELHFIEGCSAPKYNVANLHAGCVELFVGKGARLRYSTIENWSKNMYNLNTKRATVDEDGVMEWVSGSFGSHVSYLYPTTILKGDRSSCEFTGITFAGETQNLDTGCKVIMGGRDTTCSVSTKSISKGGGISTFRSSVVVGKHAENAKASISCQSLMLDDISRSDTIPAMDVRCPSANVGHEASIGRVSDDTVFYLMSRGCSENEARTMVVNGFANPVSKELPLEYAAEMNNLIKLEMEGAIG